jgi:hypothetical protein
VSKTEPFIGSVSVGVLASSAVARVPILETCIVFSCFIQKTCSQATSLYRVRWCLSKHVLLHLFSYSFFWGFNGASFLILAVCIVLAVFSRACVPRLQVCIVFSWLISKSDPKKTTNLSQVTDTLYHIILYRVRFEVTTSVVIGMNLSTIRSRHPPLFIVLSVEYICKSKACLNFYQRENSAI